MQTFLFIINILFMYYFKSTTADCQITNGMVYCEKFDSFDEISLNAENIENITLIPNKPLVLNEKLNLAAVKVLDNFKFRISNLLGIHVSGDPFEVINATTSGKFFLDDSIFECYEDDLVTLEKCNYILNNDVMITWFYFFDFFSFGSNITYSKQICPALFRNGNIKTIELNQLTNDNKLQFATVNYSDPISNLNSKIENLYIYNSTFFLEEKLLDQKVFKNISSLLIDESYLTGIQDDLFMYFSSLTRIELNLNNFAQFIQASNKWLKYLNYTNENSYLILILNDLTSTYDFPESDFCLFKNFPNSDSVKPKIMAKSDLDCTCTLMWLLKNKNQYNVDFLNSSSTNNCLNNSNFDQLISNCNFDEKLERCMDINNFCTFNNSQLECSNFGDFNELNFSNIKDVFKSVSLSPNKQIILDSTLDFQQIKFESNFQAYLNNLKGIDMEAYQFALQGLHNGSLNLDNSRLDFYFENKLIDIALCDYINKNELFVTFFDVFKSVSFGGQMKYPKEFCPIQFKKVILETLEVNNMSSGNLLSFMNISTNDEQTDLNSFIDTFKIVSSQFYLNKRLFYNGVFKNTKSLSIYRSFLFGVEYSLFIDFYLLRNIELQLLNFNTFIASDQTWMKYLNSNITVDLTNQIEISKNKDNRMILVLGDLTKSYKYPEEDFCLFRSFPHNKLVFPVVKTLDNLECTCTLIWLIQNRDLYPDIPLILNTSSVSNCLNSPMFTQMISNCNFESKLAICNGITTVSPSTNYSTTSSTQNDDNNVFRDLFISFLVLSIILLIAVGVAVFFLYRLYKAREVVRFIKLDEIN